VRERERERERENVLLKSIRKSGDDVLEKERQVTTESKKRTVVAVSPTILWFEWVQY
jgi:hypothetical protein